MDPQPVFAWELIDLSWPHRSGLRSHTPCANVLSSAQGAAAVKECKRHERQTGKQAPPALQNELDAIMKQQRCYNPCSRSTCKER